VGGVPGVATIQDVARLAGVSSATVSRTLNNADRVDPVLAARVRGAATLLRYRPNRAARSLRRRRAEVWALIISDISNPFFNALARGVEDVAQRAGFSVLLCNSDEDPAKEARYVTVAEREQVSGVIISPNARGSDISPLRNAGIPVVAVDRPLSEDVDRVVVRSRAGARSATRHLAEQGWTRPACITGPEQAATARERLAGYLEGAREAFPRLRTDLVRHADYRAVGGRAAMADLLALRRPPDAFLVGNALMALGVLEELDERGLRAGTDVGLIAFDDAPWGRFVNPPMSVVAQPAYRIGHEAAEMVLSRMAGGTDEPARHVELDTELVIRASSRRPTAADGARLTSGRRS